jgi:hypothetical protein
MAVTGKMAQFLFISLSAIFSHTTSKLIIATSRLFANTKTTHFSINSCPNILCNSLADKSIRSWSELSTTKTKPLVF